MKIRIPLYVKIIFPFIFILTLSVGFSGYHVYEESTARWQSEMDIRLQRTAELVALSVDVDTLQQIRTPADMEGTHHKQVVQSLNQTVSMSGIGWVGIYYQTARGMYYWVDSDATGVGYPFFYATAEHYATFVDGDVRQVIYTDEFGAYYGFVAPIMVEGEDGPQVIGIVEASLEDEARYLLQQSTLGRVLPILLGGGIVGIIFAIMATVFLFLRPLYNLKQGALALTGGDFDHSIIITSNDELGDLAAAFNRMSAELAALYGKLQSYNRELEQRVNVRTAELLEERDRLNIILQNIADGLVVTLPNGMIELTNPTFAQIVQRAQPQLEGLPLAEALPVPELRGLVAQTLAQPHEVFTTNITWRVPGSGLSPRVYKVLACALVEHPGEAALQDGRLDTLGVVTILHDITHEIEVDRMKTDFLSMVSHELRTPLTSVLGFAKLVRKTVEQSLLPHLPTDARVQRAEQRVRDNLDIIVSEGERLTRLINDVLDVAKIEAGKVEWHLQDVTLVNVVENAITAMSALAHEHNIPVIVDLEDGLPALHADQDRLVQVMANLLSNAIKFTEQGEVRVQGWAFRLLEDGTTDPPSAPTFQSRLRGLPGGNWMAVVVRDTGIGLAPEDHDKIFEKFKQVGDPLTNRPRGTGLGLTICKEIVEYHGGRIWAESTLGLGSTFVVVLPALAAPTTLSPRESVSRDEILAGVMRLTNRILVVDDEANIRELLYQELSAAGYEVIEAVDGVDALQKARKVHPDLIVLDLMMPGISGFDVITALRSDSETAPIPVMILSVLEDRQKGFRLGADAYLTKPLNAEHLLATIERLLKRAARGEGYKKVLVIEEDASVVETVSQIFIDKGYEVVEAGNGQEGLRKALLERPRIIILDALISKMNDYEVLRTLKCTRETQESYIIVMSRSASSEELVDLLQHGADFCSSFDDLAELVKE